MGTSSIMDRISRKILLLQHSLENSVRIGPLSAFFPIKLFNPNFRGYKGMLPLSISGFHLLTSLVLHHIKELPTYMTNTNAWIALSMSESPHPSF